MREDKPPTEAEEEATSVGFPPAEDEGIPTSKVYHPLSFPVLVLLAPGAIFGTLARLGIGALGTFDGASFTDLVYIQSIGCFVMGFCLHLREPIGQFYGPLYTALATGFCGSLTTFSTWELVVFDAWINAGQYSRGGLRDAIDGIGLSCIIVSLSVASVAFGIDVAKGVETYLPSIRYPKPLARYTASLLAVLLYAATFITYFFLSASFRHKATAALMFSFPGALTRHLLQFKLNKLCKTLPVGTLTANLLGTALLAAFHTTQTLEHPVGPRACSLLEGLADGYCACLTTVSTFAVEIRDLGGWRAVRYGLLSWALGQIFIVLIYGTPLWSGHSREEITCRFV